MEEIIKGKNIQYLECNKGGLHEGECLNLICTDQKCEKNKVLCSVCIQEEHEDHQKNIMPLKKFLALLSEKIQKNNTTKLNPEELLDNLQVSMQSSLYSLKENVQKLADQVKKLEQSMFQCQQNVKQRIMSQSYMSENMPIIVQGLINSEFSTVQQLQNNCQDLINSIKQDASNNNNFELDFNPESVYKSFKLANENFQKQMEQQTQGYNKQLETLQEIFNTVKNKGEVDESVLQNENCSQFVFSKQCKSATINLSQNNQIATQSSEGDKRFALSEQFVSQTAISYFQFKITKLQGWVGIGLALDSILKPKSYAFTNYTAVGHGCWILSSNNYTWSTSDLTQNQKQKGLNFSTDQIIVLKYDPFKKLATFVHTKDSKKAEIRVEIPKNDNTLKICVNLCQKCDAASLMPFDEKFKKLF